jgi:arylsulfatase A-like enzyme
MSDREVRFVFGHLNETDTWGHGFGPDHPDTRAVYAATDALVGELCDLLAPDWSRLVLIVLSDHGMEPATLQPPIDLLAPAPVRAAFSDMLADGSSALGLVREGVSVVRAGAALEHLPGIATWSELRPGVILIAGEPGIRFTVGPASDIVKHLRGVHGGPGSAATLALVAGGHPAVPRIARAIASRPPHLADWAPTIAGLFGADMPSVEGRNLLDPDGVGVPLAARRSYAST